MDRDSSDPPCSFRAHLCCAKVHQRIAYELSRAVVRRLAASHRVYIVGSERSEPCALLLKLFRIFLAPAGGKDGRVLKEEEDIGIGDAFERSAALVIGRRVKQRRLGRQSSLYE